MGISIKNSDRAAFIGASGSGKTELAKFFLARLNRVVVIDPKHTFKLNGFKRGWSLPVIKKEFRLIIRPRRSEDERLADFIRVLYHQGNVTLYCDEMATLADMYPETTLVLADIARTGREKKIALWSAMQRPRGTPRVFLSESEMFFVFNLRSLEDRQYVKGYAGDEVEQRIKIYQFWHVRTDEENPDLLTLNLKKNQIEKVNQI